MNSSCETTRLYIPHAHDSECKIAGDLEQVDPQVPTQGRKIILVSRRDHQITIFIVIIMVFTCEVRYYMELWGKVILFCIIQLSGKYLICVFICLSIVIKIIYTRRDLQRLYRLTPSGLIFGK